MPEFLDGYYTHDSYKIVLRYNKCNNEELCPYENILLVVGRGEVGKTGYQPNIDAW